MPAVSVIIPIFNASRTLHRCLNSLLSQRFGDIEFLCIDDGSTDNSLQICEEYAHRDARFHVFHRDNKGVSATRQFGLEHASGEYVIHLDSDDYTAPGIYEKMYETAKKEKAEIVSCDALQITENGTRHMDFSLKGASIKCQLRELLTTSFGSVWNRLIKKELIDNSHTSFTDFLQYGEDKLFLVSLLSRCFNKGIDVRFAHVAEELVYYDTTSNPHSLTKLKMGDWLRRRVCLLERMMPELNMAVFGRRFYNSVVERAFDAFWNHSAYGLTDSEYTQLFKQFKPGIRHYASWGGRKTIVLNSLDKGLSKTEHLKWLAIPAIFKDKMTQQIKQSRLW